MKFKKFCSSIGRCKAVALIAYIYVNETLIDTIGIQNISSPEAFEDTEQFNTYKIVLPEGHEHKIIKHLRKEGYAPLLISALQCIEE